MKKRLSSHEEEAGRPIEVHTASEPLNRTGYVLSMSAAALVVGLIFLPPFVDVEARAVLMKAFSAVCHQLPERMMRIADIPLGVCSRCVGIYTGLLVGAAVFPIARRWDAWMSQWTGGILLLAVGVPGADWLAGVVGIWESGHVVRLMTGAVFGAVAGYFLARGASKIASRRETPALRPRSSAS